MLARINTRIGKMVFCYLNGKHSIPLMLSVVRGNPDVEFYFHARTFAGVDFMSTPMSECPNAHFVGNFDELKFKLNLFGAFITTDANAAQAHVYSLKLVSMFKALGIPVFELQHGLFQIGLHYYDVPSGVSFWGDSLPSKSFAERVLAFYPPIRRTPPSTVIGYPPYSGALSDCGGGEYLLILTNLHWPTYAADEKMAFLDAVAALVESRPELPVVWKMHHAETPPASKINQMVGESLGRHPDAKRRIRFAHSDAELKGMSTAEIIAGAKYVVSTVSTVLLDCEIHRRPTAVYSCASNACLVKMIKTADTFSDGDSLLALFGRGLRPISTGKLRPYDNTAFRAALDASYKPSPITQTEFLSLLLSQTFRDDFIARNTAAKDATIAALRKSDEARGAALADMKAELEDAVRENGKVAAERDAARGELEDAIRGNGKVAAERDAMRDELSVAKGELDALKAGLDKTTSENKRLESALAERLNVCAAKDAAVVECMHRIDELKRDLASLTDLKETLVGRCEAVVRERDELRLQLSACRAGAEALKNERDSLAGNLVVMKSLVDDRIAICNKTCSDVRGQNSRLVKEKADLHGKLGASQRQASILQRNLDETRRRLDRSCREVIDLKRRLASRSVRKRFNCLIKGLLPYGVTCTWKRMVYGICEDRPLFAFPGFFKRCWRIVKFSSPYFVVALFKRMRYGSPRC